LDGAIDLENILSSFNNLKVFKIIPWKIAVFKGKILIDLGLLKEFQKFQKYLRE